MERKIIIILICLAMSLAFSCADEGKPVKKRPGDTTIVVKITPPRDLDSLFDSRAKEGMGRPQVSDITEYKVEVERKPRIELRIKASKNTSTFKEGNIVYEVILSNYTKNDFKYGYVDTVTRKGRRLWGKWYEIGTVCIRKYDSLWPYSVGYNTIVKNDGSRGMMKGDKDSLYWYILEPGKRRKVDDQEYFNDPGLYDVYVVVPVPFSYDPKGYITSDTVRFEVKMPPPQEAAAWRFLKARLESKEPVVARNQRDSTNIPDSRIKDDPDVRNALEWLKERYAYEDVIKKYPNTKAAEYAREQLKH